MSNLALEAKSYKALKAIGKKYGLTNVNVKRAKLIENITKVIDTEKESAESATGPIEDDQNTSHQKKSHINYRRMIQRFDPELYKVLNPILHLLPDMRPVVDEYAQKEKSDAFKSFLLDWDPWMQVYLELDGISSSMGSESSYASLVLTPVYEEIDKIEEVVTADAFMAFWNLFPTLSYIYALQYDKFLFLAVYYDLQAIFNISNAVDLRITLAADLDLEEKKKLLWSVDSPEVLAYLVYGSTADKDKLHTLHSPPWVEGGYQYGFNRAALTTEYVRHYLSSSSSRLFSSILSIKTVVSDLKKELRYQGSHQDPLREYIQWGDAGTKEKVIALLAHKLVNVKKIALLAIKNHENGLFSEIFGTIGRSYSDFTSNKEIMVATMLAENVGVLRILAAAHYNINAISFDASLDGKRTESFTPLLWAVRVGNPLLLEVLLEEDLHNTASQSSRRSVSPLSQAVLDRDTYMVKMILDHTSRIDHADSAGKTAFNYATEKGFDDIAALLEDHDSS